MEIMIGWKVSITKFKQFQKAIGSHFLILNDKLFLNILELIFKLFWKNYSLPEGEYLKKTGCQTWKTSTSFGTLRL